jgi:hypothetical protein
LFFDDARDCDRDDVDGWELSVNIVSIFGSHVFHSSRFGSQGVERDGFGCVGSKLDT